MVLSTGRMSSLYYYYSTESRTDTDDADSGNYDSVSNHPHNRDEPRPYFLTIITSCIGVCIICFFIGIVLHQWKPAIGMDVYDTGLLQSEHIILY